MSPVHALCSGLPGYLSGGWTIGLSSDDDMCLGLGMGCPTFLETCARSMLPGTALWVLLFFGEPVIIVSHGSVEPEAVG